MKGNRRWERAARREGEEKRRRKLQSIMCKRTGKCSDKGDDKICTTESQRRELGRRNQEIKKYEWVRG